MSERLSPQPKQIAPPCPISGLLLQLDEDSTAAAQRCRAQGRSARAYRFLAFPLYLAHAYVTQRPFRLGVVGLTLAALRAFRTFMTWAKVWEAEHGDEGQLPIPAHAPARRSP